MKNILEKKYTPVEIADVSELAAQAPDVLVEKSEDYYNHQVLDAAKKIQAKPECKFVLLCGPSASGKTTTAHKLMEQLVSLGVGARVISMDNFFLGLQAYPKLPNGQPDMESIEAVDLELLNKCFKELMTTGTTVLPVFDFAAQKRGQELHPISLRDGEVLIMEGIHALNPRVLSDIPRENVFRIYVSVRSKFINGDEVILIPKDIRLMRRMARDHKFRGWPPLSTLRQWANVLSAEKVNIDLYRDDVDLKMDNTIDYEVCVWRDLLKDLLADEEDYALYPEINRIFQGLTRFPALDYNLIPGNSLLREFIGE